MCNPAIIRFGEHLAKPDVAGKAVLEVGSRLVQTDELSLRHRLEGLGPASYFGVDIILGRGVDQLVSIYELESTFGTESFDVVVCTEVVEHVRDWRAAFHNLKAVVRPNGLLLLTTRSPGMAYHGYPHDYWRYTIEDIRLIFADMSLEALEQDTDGPGVFVLVRKPQVFLECDCSAVALTSIIGRKRRLSSPAMIVERSYVAALIVYRNLRSLLQTLGGKRPPLAP